MESQNTTGQKPFIAAADSDSTRLVRTADDFAGLSTNASSCIEAAVCERFANIEIKTGTLIGGAYKLLTRIGRGGMGDVYRARHIVLGKDFAVKLLTGQELNNANWLRFQTEARVISRLDHKNIVKVYNLGLHENVLPFYAMDLLEGEPLDAVLQRLGPLKIEDCLPLYLQVLDGLHYAHRHGVVHRDIKPANIMLIVDEGPVPIVKLLDFGIAKLSGLDNKISQSLTAPGEIFGSPYYMSPEQCLGQKVDPRSDVYSVGCALFETLTGRPPFRGENSFKTICMHNSDNPPSLKQVTGLEFPAAMEHVVARCLKKRPEERYQSMKDMEVDLIRIGQGKDLHLQYITALEEPQSALVETDESGRSTGRTTLRYTHQMRRADFSTGDDAITKEKSRSAARVLLLGGITLAASLAVGVAVMLFREQPQTKVNLGSSTIMGEGLHSSLVAVAEKEDFKQIKYLKRQASKNRAKINELAKELPAKPKELIIGQPPVTPPAQAMATIEPPKALLDDVHAPGAENAMLEATAYNGQIFNQGECVKNGYPVTRFVFYPMFSIGDISWQAGQFADGRKYPNGTAGCVSTVYVPKGAKLVFRGQNNLAMDPRALQGFKANDLWGLSLNRMHNNMHENLNSSRHLKSLRNLEISETSVMADSIGDINALPNLTELEARKTNLTAGALVGLIRLRALTALNIKEIDGPPSEVLAKLKGSKTMTSLKVSDLNLSKGDLNFIVSMPNLKELHIHNTNLSDQDLQKLAGLKKLKSLSITGTELTPAAAAIFKSAMPKLENLEIGLRIDRWKKADKEALKRLYKKVDFISTDSVESWKKEISE